LHHLFPAIALAEIEDRHLAREFRDLAGGLLHDGLRLLARFVADEIADAAPFAKAGRFGDMHHPPPAATLGGPPAGIAQGCLQFRGIVDDHEKDAAGCAVCSVFAWSRRSRRVGHATRGISGSISSHAYLRRKIRCATQPKARDKISATT